MSSLVMIVTFSLCVCVCVKIQWQHEDILGPNNQPLSVSIPPRSVILSNMKKKLYKLSQDEGAIVAIQVSITQHTVHILFQFISHMSSNRATVELS